MTPHADVIKEWAAMRPSGGFRLIMCDPPWSFATRSDKGRGRSADRHYDCTPLEWIEGLPVSMLAADNCLLWLWATNPMLPQALDVLRAWGFTFSTAGHWAKRTKTGKLAFGTGYVLRCAGEPFLIGKRGSPKVEARNVRSVIEGPVREHSRKPDEAFDAAARLISGPKIEVFSRESRPGWHTWGDQTGMLDSG